MSAEQTKQAQDKINQMTRIIAAMTPEDKTDPAKLSAAARGRVARLHFHRRHPDPGQGRRQRRERGACGDERVVFCGEADLFFLYGIFFLCVCAYLPI